MNPRNRFLPQMKTRKTKKIKIKKNRIYISHQSIIKIDTIVNNRSIKFQCGEFVTGKGGENGDAVRMRKRLTVRTLADVLRIVEALLVQLSAGTGSSRRRRRRRRW